MGYLDRITRGKIQVPEVITIHGPDGIGKSTFAASAPSPIFLGPEAGTSNLDVARFERPASFNAADEQVEELIKESHDFKTLVIDSVDWLEPIVQDWVCEENGWKNIESPGYGKGYAVALKQWRTFVDKLQVLRDDKQMNVVLIAHSVIKPFHDPQENTVYDRFVLKMHDKVSALIREFSDTVLFANFEIFTKKEDGQQKAKAFGDGERVMYTERRPAFDAKNRWGLPFKMPLSWDAYMDARKPPQSDGEIREKIQIGLSKITDDAVKNRIDGLLADAKDSTALLSILDRMNKYLARGE